jgi:PAS domain S-box-containing protein
MIENNTEVLTLINSGGQILYASPCCASVFGFTAEEFVGRNTFGLIHPEDRFRSHRTFEAVLARPARPHQIEVRVRQRPGSVRADIKNRQTCRVSRRRTHPHGPPQKAQRRRESDADRAERIASHHDFDSSSAPIRVQLHELRRFRVYDRTDRRRW